MSNEKLIPLKLVEKYTKSSFYDLYGDLTFYVSVDDWFLVSDSTSKSPYTNRVYLKGFFPISSYWKASSMEEAIANRAQIVFDFNIEPSELNSYKLPELLTLEIDLIHGGKVPILTSKYREGSKPTSLYNLWVKQPDLINFLENHGLEEERQRVIDDFMYPLTGRDFVPVAEHMELLNQIDEQAEKIEQLEGKLLKPDSELDDLRKQLKEAQAEIDDLKNIRQAPLADKEIPLRKASPPLNVINDQNHLKLLGCLMSEAKPEEMNQDAYLEYLEGKVGIASGTLSRIFGKANKAYKT